MKMEETGCCRVGKNKEAVRIVDYLLRLEEDVLAFEPSRNYLKKAVKEGRITIDGKRAVTADFPREGQIIRIFEKAEKPAKIYKLKIPVIFEDEYLAVVNKPAGLLVSGNQFRTLQNTLPYNLQPSSLPQAFTNPKPVHRLDYLTSGLLMIAKTMPVRRSLGDMFAERKIRKTYIAVVIGKTPSQNTINLPVEGKSALTSYKTLKIIPSLICQWLSLLEVKPQTGRKHQIRKHLANTGFPVLGDKLYGCEGKIFRGKGLFLSAAELEFHHPVTAEKIHLKITEPNKFQLHLQREEKRYLLNARNSQ